MKFILYKYIGIYGLLIEEKLSWVDWDLSFRHWKCGQDLNGSKNGGHAEGVNGNGEKKPRGL